MSPVVHDTGEKQLAVTQAAHELFKEPHDEAVHENSYKSKLYELISASLAH
ncbi:hypothetical protein [Dialister succinatiphilus]|uniref:hypothetical protein n=1 Tax=Dialister succinatiphilus TaxID=487173 RepID=UPI003FEF47DF